MKPKGGADPIDTLAFTESLGLQTFRRNGRNAWSKDEDTLLLNTIERMHPNEYAAKEMDAVDVDWEAVALVFEGAREGKDCKRRWASSINPALRRGKWTKEEDELLLQLYQRYGSLWQQVAHEIKGRTEHQCLKRFLEVLDPALQNRLAPWTETEDIVLIRAVKQHGTKWKTVAGKFQGRPPLTCRNRWRNLANSVARGRASDIVLNEISQVVDGDLRAKLSELAEKRADTSDRKVKRQKKSNSLVLSPEDVAMSLDPEHLPLELKQEGSSLAHVRSSQYGTMGPEVEWKYGLATRNGESLANFGPLQKLLESGGAITSKELAHYLVECAARQNLEITVHQHIHHHHKPPGGTGATQNGQRADSGLSYRSRSEAQPTYEVEPETQFSRYQHFNYLPPLTETPKLNSSASSPATSSKGSTHHHHHHYHHHHHHDQNQGKDLSLEDDAATKESDLIKLLNEADGRKKLADENMSDAMTPLTQAVQMVAAAERSEPYKERDNEQYDDKMHLDHLDEEAEEGLDFFETMRNLNVATKSDRVVSKTGTKHQEMATAQPVSQHHPLHYFTSSVTPQPENPLDEEEEDIINSYGLFYNAYQRDAPMDQAALLDAPAPYGAIPFNPS